MASNSVVFCSMHSACMRASELMAVRIAAEDRLAQCRRTLDAPSVASVDT